ncbi:MAG: hypothetical protein Q9164_004348 [Protoblastenia rupestris]
MEESLQVFDTRTGKLYPIPIHNGDYIQAADIGQIAVPEAKYLNGEAKHMNGDTAPQIARPLRILDNGYQHTACMESSITYMRDSDTYPMILAGMSAFAASDSTISATRHQQKPMFHGSLEIADQALLRTVAYIASTIGLIYCHKNEKVFTNPEKDRSLIGNLLLMMGYTDPKIEQCLNKLWILYADHEMTNSTAAVLHAGSTLCDPISAAISGIVSAYGPLHGGAIDLAYEAFKQIGKPEAVPFFIEGVKLKKLRLFGYGHRVYKTRDPRAALIEELMQEHRDAVDANPLLRVAMAIDKAANQDPYFVDRGLKANADLMGCFLYTAM